MKKDPPALLNEIVPSKGATPQLALTLDMEKYLGQLEDWNVDEEEKSEFIAALWNLLRTFAEIGFEIHPVQQAQKACGLLSKTPTKSPIASSNELYSRDSKPTIISKDFGACGATEAKEIQP